MTSDAMRYKALKAVREGRVRWVPAQRYGRLAHFAFTTDDGPIEIKSIGMRIALCQLRMEQGITVNETTGDVKVAQP